MMHNQQQSSPLNLEEELRILCIQEGLDLHLRLERIKKSAEIIWAKPRLYWFTDHGVSHSKRIISILGKILSHVQTEMPSRLTCSELYILLAACYLHDIGMQFFKIANKGVEEYNDEDYELIRRQHPGKAKDFIISRTIQQERDEFRIDLDDEPDYLVPIALVCKAHGSEFFDATVEELKNITYQPGGSPFRGGLLASLLMLGDELDLDLKRAIFPKDQTLSSISALHYHIHSYITRVIINNENTEKRRQVWVDMIFPPECKYQPLVIGWLAGKLHRQIRRTSKIIEKATNGELAISHTLIFKTDKDKNSVVRQLPESALNVLRKEVAEFKMVNQDKPREVYRQMLNFPSTVRSLLLVPADELSGSESIDWLESQCKYKKIDCHITNFSNEPYSINDLIQALLRFICKPSNNASKELTSDVIDSKNENPLGVFLDRLAEITQSKQIIFVFQNFNHAEDRVAEWVYNKLIRGIHQIPHVSLILTCTTVPKIFDGGARFQERVPWDRISRESIEEAFRSYGFDSEDAQMNAERVFSYTKGQPEYVILGLETERKQWIK